MKKRLNYFIKTSKSDNYYAEDIKDNLLVIAKKLARIEDKNPDYLTDKVWNQLRNKQDNLYELLRRQKCLSNQQNKKNTPTKLCEYSKMKTEENLLQR